MSSHDTPQRDKNYITERITSYMQLRLGDIKREGDLTVPHK